MSLHKEISFEAEICDYLATHGWLYSETDEGYDRARVLFPADVVSWVQATQPTAWETLTKRDILLNNTRLWETLRAQVVDTGLRSR